MSRPAARAAAAVLAALALASAAGCSPFQSSDTAAPAAVAGPLPTHHAVEGRAYPVTVTHRYGDTLLSEPPDRIVTLGLHDQDTLISLGLRPVGIRDWPGTSLTYAGFGWSPEDLRPGDIPVVSPRDRIDFDAVAALHPDLITAVHSDLTQADYEHLTEIAPVVAQPPDVGDFQSSWQEETRLMGLAVGRPQAAEEVIDNLEATFVTARETYPVLEDAEVALVVYAADGTLHLVNPYDPRGRLLAALGMSFPDSVVEAVGDAEFDAPVGLAELGRLAGLDAVVWLADPTAEPAATARAAEALRADPAYGELELVRKGASAFLDVPEAVSFASGTSLAYAAERNARTLAAALHEKAARDQIAVTPGAHPGDGGAGKKGKKAKPPKPTPGAEATPTPTPQAPVPTAPAETPDVALPTLPEAPGAPDAGIPAIPAGPQQPGVDPVGDPAVEPVPPAQPAPDEEKASRRQRPRDSMG